MTNNGENSDSCDVAESDKRNEIIIRECAEQKDKMYSPYNKYVNAHINNISFPKSLEELEIFIYKHGCYNVEDILNCENGNEEWTVPRNSCVGDIVLFYHAKTAIQWISKLESEVRRLNSDSTIHDIQLINSWLCKARKLYSLYGGKIFAVGQISAKPFYEENPRGFHWSGRIYANITDIFLLKNPIDISKFNSFILVSRQSAITPLPSVEYNHLKEIIMESNDVPEYFSESKIGDVKLSQVNFHNFLQITAEYRRRFLYEIDFRSYYVNYFLSSIAGKKYYRECACYNSNNVYFVDNVVFLNGRYILFEVKLSIKEPLNKANIFNPSTVNTKSKGKIPIYGHKFPWY